MPGSVPLSALTLILTSDCNLRCAYCYQARRDPRAMGWQTVRTSLDLLLGSGQPRVKLQFIGGEPLLAFPLLVRTVEYVEARTKSGPEVEFEISTNGTLVGDREAEFLAKHDFDLQVSFDGVEAAQRLRGQGTFPVLDGLLGRLRRDRPLYFLRRVSVAVTALARNVPALAASVEYFLAKGVPRILIGPALTHQAEWRPAGLRVLDREFSRMFAVSLRHYRRTGQVPLAMFAHGGSVPPMPGPWMCGAGGGQSIAVDVDGEVSGCVLFARSYARYPRTPLGRALAATRLGRIDDPALPHRLARYGPILQASGIFHNRWSKHSSLGRCITCAWRRDCRVCPICIVHQPGNLDPDRIPDFACAFSRTAAKYRRRFPAMPSAEALLSGRVPLPGLVQELVDFAAARPRPQAAAAEPDASSAG